MKSGRLLDCIENRPWHFGLRLHNEVAKSSATRLCTPEVTDYMGGGDSTATLYSGGAYAYDTPYAPTNRWLTVTGGVTSTTTPYSGGARDRLWH